MNAIIKYNNLYCPFCEEHEYRIGTYKQITQGTQMTGICRKCGRKFEYMLSLKLEGTKRFVIEESEEE